MANRQLSQVKEMALNLQVKYAAENMDLTVTDVERVFKYAWLASRDIRLAQDKTVTQ